MSFVPRVLHPEVDPAFALEVKRVDPALRVVWGYDRYFVHKWVIERKLTPERYQRMYAQALKEDWPRFVEQPIFDTNQPVWTGVLDVDGNEIRDGYRQVGARTFDIRPEWEWLMQFDVQDGRALLELKRGYAWQRNHPLSRARYEEQQRIAEMQKEAEAKRKRVDIQMESVEQAWHEHSLRRSYVLDKGESNGDRVSL